MHICRELEKPKMQALWPEDMGQVGWLLGFNSPRVKCTF